MPVRVPGPHLDAPLAGPCGLRAHLGRDVGEADPAGHEAGGEIGQTMEAAVGVDERGDGRGVGHGPAADEVDVQPDLELGLGAGELGALLAVGERHKQGRRPHHAVAMRLQHASVHPG